MPASSSGYRISGCNSSYRLDSNPRRLLARRYVSGVTPGYRFAERAHQQTGVGDFKLTSSAFAPLAPFARMEAEVESLGEEVEQ